MDTEDYIYTMEETVRILNKWADYWEAQDICVAGSLRDAADRLEVMVEVEKELEWEIEDAT